MFIITGNNIKEQKVRILDSSDKKEDWVTYGKMHRGISQGLCIVGLDAHNNIVCQSLDLYDELLYKLRLLEAKFVLLKLDSINQHRLILDLLALYGLAQIPDDIQYSFDMHMLILYEHGKCLDLKSNSTRDVRVGIKHRFGEIIQAGLNGEVYIELNQMIFDMQDNTLHYLQYNSNSRSYFAIIGTCCFEVQISNSNKCTSLATFKQHYNKYTTHKVFFELYLEDVWFRIHYGDLFVTRMNLIMKANTYNEEVKQKMLQEVDWYVKQV